MQLMRPHGRWGGGGICCFAGEGRACVVSEEYLFL